MPLQVGKVLQDRYRIDGLLGTGGMGAVYRGMDLRLNHPVAIKENLEFDDSAETSPNLPPEDTEYVEKRREQFELEAQLLARLRHPALPKVTDHFILPGQGQYLVMEFIEGKSLKEILDTLGKVDVDQSMKIAFEVMSVLEYLHGQNPPIIHRDIKPANLRMATDGRVVLVDFGIAKEADALGRTKTGARGVTPGYSPVEQYGGTQQTDARTDIHALGATLYSLLSGEAPPSATDRVVGRPLTRLAGTVYGVNPALQKAIERSMELMPQDRFQTVAEFRRALEAAMKGSADTMSPGETMIMPGAGGSAEDAATVTQVPTAPGDTPVWRSSTAGAPPGGGGFFGAAAPPAGGALAAGGSGTDAAAPARSAPGAIPGGVPGAAPGATPGAVPGGVPAATPGAAPGGSPGAIRRAESPATTGAGGSTVSGARRTPAPEELPAGAEGGSKRSVRRAGMIVLFLVALGAAWVGLRRLGESPVEPRVPSPAPNGLASGPAAGAAPEQSPGEPASGERVGQEEPAGGAAAGRESAGQEPAGGEVIAQEGAGQEAARGKGTGQTQHGGPPAEPPVESRPAPVVPPAPKQAGEPAAGSEGTPAETRSPATTPPAPSEPAPGATPPVTTTTERTEPAVEAKPPSPPESKEAQTPPELPPPAPAIVPLTAVALQIPAHPTQSTVELAWTPSAATGFSRYEIHHSTSAGFSPSPATLYATDLRDRNQTHLEIRNLECGVTHYFKVRVEDTDGHFADSPEQSMATLPCPFPDQIVVSTRGDGAYTDLVKAIQAINENSEAKPGMKVVLREGTYTLQERIWIGKSIEIVGENAVVEASGAGAFVMQATEATIRGVTFRAASQSAINVPEGSLTLEDCNVRSVQGSAVDIYGPGSIEIHRSELAGSGGKGLLVRGKGQATLEDCHIDGNQSGIDVSDNGRATLHGCRIDTSTQSGVYVHGGGQVTLEGCSVTGNQYSGVSVQDNAVVRLDRCKLNGNAQYGLNVGAGANVTLADCDLTGNGYGPLYEEDGSRVSQQGDNRMK